MIIQVSKRSDANTKKVESPNDVITHIHIHARELAHLIYDVGQQLQQHSMTDDSGNIRATGFFSFPPPQAAALSFVFVFSRLI